MFKFLNSVNLISVHFIILMIFLIIQLLTNSCSFVHLCICAKLNMYDIIYYDIIIVYN